MHTIQCFFLQFQKRINMEGDMEMEMEMGEIPLTKINCLRVELVKRDHAPPEIA